MTSIRFDKLARAEYELEYFPQNYTEMFPPPDYSFNVLYKHGLLYRPILDEVFLERGGRKPAWPEGREFAVCLTHDVDRVSHFCRHQALRRFGRSLASVGKGPTREYIGRLLGTLKIIKNSLLHRGEDPLHNLDDWLNIEASVGVRSTFFFFPEKVRRRHSTDCLYNFSDRVVFDGESCSVGELMKEIDRRGWEIGLHASWYAFDDGDELKFQKEQIEDVVGHEIASVRQHILHYDLRVTPRCHVEAGFLYDSTLGFNHNVGFRFGTCYPWCLFEVTTGEPLPILEIPLIAQDIGLFSQNGLGFDRALAFRHMKHLTEVVKQVGGVLTILWHPDAPSIDKERWYLYENLLEYFREMGAWTGCVRDIGEAWQTQERILREHKSTFV